MPCNTYRSPDGKVTAIVCSRGARRPMCHVSGCRHACEALCDYPVTTHASGTCDKPCCRSHAEQVGADRDYCLIHAEHDRRMKAKQEAK